MTLPIVFGALAFTFVAALAWAICRSAAQADRAINRMRRDELAERRSRRDARNGLGKAS